MNSGQKIGSIALEFTVDKKQLCNKARSLGRGVGHGLEVPVRYKFFGKEKPSCR